jgi:hypothetical protein
MKTLAVALIVTAVLHFGTQEAALAASDVWTGSVGVEDARVYDAPAGRLLGTLQAGTPVGVSSWVYGPALTSDNYTWADIRDGRFVHSSVLRHSPLRDSPPDPPRLVSAGHWADANLTLQILTLYDGSRSVHMALMNSGRPGPDTESHPGAWPIASRVADETMRGDGYDISGVLFTQYFTPDAEAVHLNYWLTDEERGIPRSHGCLGLAYDDAAFAWRFLDIGSLVFVHA